MNKVKKSCVLLSLALALIFIFSFTSFAIDSLTGSTGGGVTKVHISISDLDTSGNYYYRGVDITIFSDEGTPGNFKVKAGKITRMLTDKTEIDVELGNINDFKIGAKYKIGYRILYSTIGSDSSEIIVADMTNGKDGWRLLKDNNGDDLYFTKNNYPTINLTTALNQIISAEEGNKTIIISGSVQDSDIGEALEIFYRVDGNEGEPGVSLNIHEISNGNQQSFNRALDLSGECEGGHKLYVWVVDSIGYKSQESLILFKVDKTAPNANKPVLEVLSPNAIKISTSSAIQLIMPSIVETTTSSAIQLIMPSIVETTTSSAIELNYLYIRNGINLGTWSTDNSYTDSGLTPNTRYTYKYKVKDIVGNVGESEEDSAYTMTLNPANVQLISKTENSMTIKITNASGQGEVPKHKLELKLKNAGESGGNKGLSDWSSVEARTISGLEENTEYELWIQTRNGDGIKNKKYKIDGIFKTSIYIPPTISSLTVSKGTLSPAFNSNITSYTVNVGNSVTNINITAALEDSNAAMKINGDTVLSRTSKKISNLQVGNNYVDIVIKAKDGTTKTYTVTIKRARKRIVHYPDYPDTTTRTTTSSLNKLKKKINETEKNSELKSLYNKTFEGTREEWEEFLIELLRRAVDIMESCEDNKFIKSIINQIPEEKLENLEERFKNKTMIYGLNYKEWEGHTVHPAKKWTIKFNFPLNPKTIKVGADNFFICDEDGYSVDIEIKHYSINNKVKVIPKKNYKSKKKYYLIIGTAIESDEGTKLKNPVRLSFDIE